MGGMFNSFHRAQEDDGLTGQFSREVHEFIRGGDVMPWDDVGAPNISERQTSMPLPPTDESIRAAQKRYLRTHGGGRADTIFSQDY